MFIHVTKFNWLKLKIADNCCWEQDRFYFNKWRYYDYISLISSPTSGSCQSTFSSLHELLEIYWQLRRSIRELYRELFQMHLLSFDGSYILAVSKLCRQQHTITTNSTFSGDKFIRFNRILNLEVKIPNHSKLLISPLIVYN